MTVLTLPPALVTAVQEQRAILFLGSGASIGAQHPRNEPIPLGDKLRDKISDQFFAGALRDRPLTAVAAMAAREVGLTFLQKYIRDVFVDFTPAEFHLLLPTFRWQAIASTNFDLLIERAYENSQRSLQTLVKPVKDGDLFDTRMNETSDPLGF